MPYDGKSGQSFTMLPLKANIKIKNMDVHDRIPSNLALSRHEFPSGVRRRSLLEHDTPARSMAAGMRDVNLGPLA
jgi:hypothetical protein